jgi:hypothetical protein
MTDSIPTDFRAALERLLQAYDDHGGNWLPHHEQAWFQALDDARAILDSPPLLPYIGPEWQPCVKLPITVHVREQRPGETHISTRDGITPVRPDDLIMRGEQGEEYPIGCELFNSTYRLGEATSPRDEIDFAAELADVMEEDGYNPDFPEMEEITPDDLISAAVIIRKYVCFKQIQDTE